MNVNDDLSYQYDNLIRKIDDTRRSRFHMATRLREEHEWRNKLLLFYNVVIIILSIVTMYQYFVDHVPMASHIILSFSISLSLYSTHLGGTSRLETAGVMNQNANALSSILSTVTFSRSEILSVQEHLTNIQKLTQTYESTIDNVENHAPIDYIYIKRESLGKPPKHYTVRTTDGPVASEEVSKHEQTETKPTISSSKIDELNKRYISEIKKYERNECLKRVFGYAGGILLAIVIIFYPSFSDYIKVIFPQ